MIDQQRINAMKRISEEFKQLSRSPFLNFGITVGLFNDDNIFEWRCTITGPKDTAYERGYFYLKIIFPDNYPIGRPEVMFLTPIYHLNVKYFKGGTHPLGHINMTTLNQWNHGDSIKKILPEIYIFLYKNNPDCAYDDSNYTRRNEFVNNQALFVKKAQYFTKKYASLGLHPEMYLNDWDFSF